MRLTQFVAELKKLGYYVERSAYSSGDISIMMNENHKIARIDNNEIGRIDTYYTGGVDNLSTAQVSDLLTLLSVYAQTPVTEREDVKMYQFKFRDDILEQFEDLDQDGYLNYIHEHDTYMFSDDIVTSSYTTHFSQHTIDTFPDAVKDMIKLCRKIEVTKW